jgi:hypothetical protein
MIRRAVEDEFLLIAQHDHALLSGEMARRIGNELFAPPSPYEAVVEGIAQHDCGWPLHDENPTLNASGRPLHVFETPVGLATQVWNASVARAMNLGAYQGLLVSLHALGLSAFAMAHAKNPSRADVFEMNKFQHRQIEIQEDLRARLGLSNDLPRQLGLAAPGASADEDLLRFNFRLLTAMDRISLALCCGENLFATLEDIYPRPGAGAMRLTLSMPDSATMVVTPWPFDQGRLCFEVPARRVPDRAFATAEELQERYRQAPTERVMLTVCAKA